MIHFEKWQALGNDFVILPPDAKVTSLSKAQCQKLANRRLGIGCDQILTVQHLQNTHYQIAIYNADGSKAEQCGNGLRAIATLLGELTQETSFTLENAYANSITLATIDAEQETVCLELPAPDIEVCTQPMDFVWVNMGNPHAIISAATNDANAWSAAQNLATHADYPEGLNVSLVEIIDQNHIKLRVYERGTGETPACGSAACAAVCAGIYQQKLSKEVTVTQRGGTLSVNWAGGRSPVYLNGRADFVFKGTITL